MLTSTCHWYLVDPRQLAMKSPGRPAAARQWGNAKRVERDSDHHFAGGKLHLVEPVVEAVGHGQQ
jgi:hypothetical protein